jgi:hypothetical protein
MWGCSTVREDQARSDCSAHRLADYEVVRAAGHCRDAATRPGSFAEIQMVEGGRSCSGGTGVLVLFCSEFRFLAIAHF